MRSLIVILWVMATFSLAFGLYALVDSLGKKDAVGLIALTAGPFWIGGIVAMGLAGIMSVIDQSRIEQVAALLRISSLGQMQLDKATSVPG